MHLESATSGVNRGLALGHAKQAAKAEQEPPQVTDSATPATESEDSSNQRGVIRNLLAGHYQGVADVRLRINFFDELQAMERGGVEQAMAQPMPDLAAMQDDLAGIMALGDELGPEVLEAAQNVDGLVQDLALAEGMSRDEALSLVDQLRTSFENLVQALDAFLAAQAAAAEEAPPAPAEPEAAAEPAAAEPPAAEPPAQDPAAAEPSATEPPSEVSGVEPPTPQAEPEPEPGPDPMALVSEFLANWGDLSLLDQLGVLEQSLGQAPSLPELSPAGDNNGRAYAKFLARYEELQFGGTGGVAAPEGEVRIDAVV